MSQTEAEASMFRSLEIDGSATLIRVASRTDRQMPQAMTSIAQ